MTLIALLRDDLTGEARGKSVDGSRTLVAPVDLYCPSVKTTVTIPDNLVREAEAAARTLGISRSQLFTTAISEFLERHRASKITERLNEIYSQERSELDPVLARLQAESLKDGD